MIRVVLGTVLIGAVAWASTPGGASAEPAEAAPATDKKEVAKRYVDAGDAAQRAGDYDTAIALFQKAYRLVPHPKLIFDIAQAQRFAGRLDDALREYKHYVAIEPSGEEAQTARDFITKIEITLAQRSTHDTPGSDSRRGNSSVPTPDVRGAHDVEPTPAAPASSLAERPAPPNTASKRAAIGFGGGALVLFGAAWGFDHASWVIYRKAKDETTSASRSMELYSSANTRYYIAQALAATGVACAGAALWLYLGRRDGPTATPTRHELVVSPTGVAVIGSF